MADSKPLSKEQADKLLDLLSKDDKFRDLFVKDYKAAMKQIGVSNPAPCNSVTKLANKESIAKARTELAKQLISVERSFTPVQLQIDNATSKT